MKIYKTVLTTKKDLLYINKRFMHRIGRSINMNVIRYSSDRAHYATARAYNLNSAEAKKFATDGTGKHAVVVVNECKKKDCLSTKCLSVCENDSKIVITKHLTHNPPSTTKSEKVGDYDYNGDQKDQFAVERIATPISDEDIKKFNYNFDATNYINSTEDIFRKVIK